MNHSHLALYSYQRFSLWNQVKSPVEARLLRIKRLVNFSSECKTFRYKWKQVHYGPQAVNAVPGSEIEPWHYSLRSASFSPAVLTHLSPPETYFIFFLSQVFIKASCMQEHLENRFAKSVFYISTRILKTRTVETHHTLSWHFMFSDRTLSSPSRLLWHVINENGLTIVLVVKCSVFLLFFF